MKEKLLFKTITMALLAFLLTAGMLQATGTSIYSTIMGRGEAVMFN